MSRATSYNAACRRARARNSCTANHTRTIAPCKARRRTRAVCLPRTFCICSSTHSIKVDRGLHSANSLLCVMIA